MHNPNHKLPSPNSDLWPFKLNIGTSVTPALATFRVGPYTNHALPALFRFRVRSPYGTDRRTDGRVIPALRPIRTAASTLYCTTNILDHFVCLLFLANVSMCDDKLIIIMKMVISDDY